MTVSISMKENDALRILCACLHDREKLVELSKHFVLDDGTKLGAFRTLGYLALRALLKEKLKAGSAVTISPDRIRSLIRRCGVDDGRTTKTIMRAIRSLFKMLGIYHYYNKDVFLVESLKQLDRIVIQ